MADIASLGLSIDSTPVERARDEFGRFVTAAKSAENAAKGFEQSTAKAGVAAGGLSKQITAALNSVEAVNRRLNVRDSFGGAERAADIAAYGQELDKLRARYNPLFAVQQTYRAQVDDISKAAKVGALSEDEKSVALLRAEQAYKNQTKAISLNEQQILKSGKAALVSGYQMQNLAFQVNDVATMAAMGMDPLRIFTSQAGQIYQVLSMTEGGARAALGEIGTHLAAMVTPISAVTAGFVAMGVASAAALNAAVQDSIEVQVALSGVGRASGMTAETIESISLAAARAGDATVGNARTMALEFAKTGKIGPEIAADLIGMSKQFAATFGEDIPEATERMARALADPAKGVDDLNKRLGTYDDRTRQLILNLTAQNRTFEAQRVLMDAAKSGLVDHADATSRIGRAWQLAVEDMSTYWAKLKGRLIQTVEGPSIADQLKDANAELAKLSRWSTEMPSFWQPTQKEVEATVARVKELTAAENERNKANDQAARDRKAVGEGNAVSGIARAVVPDYDRLRTATSELIRLRDAIANPTVFNGFDAYTKLAVLRAEELREHQAEWLKAAIEGGGVAITMAREENAIAMKGITARTTAQKAELAYQQELTRARREDPSNANERADMARSRVFLEAKEQEEQAIKARNFRQQETIDLMKLEAELVGKSTVQAAGLRAAWEVVADAKRRAFERGEELSPVQLEKAKTDGSGWGAKVTSSTSRTEGRRVAEDIATPAQEHAKELERLNALYADGALKVGEYKRAVQLAAESAGNTWHQNATTVIGAFQTVAGAVDSQNKAMVKANQIAGYANAIISTNVGIAKAMELPFPMNWAQATAVAAQGFAAAAAIKNQSKSAPSTSASSSGGSRSSSGSSSSSYQSSMTNQATAPLQQTVVIQATGSRYSREELRDIIEGINTTLRDGTRLEFQGA
jgi:hypothetical protein